MDSRILLLILNSLTFLTLSQTKRPFTIEYNNFTCKVLDPMWVQELNCTLHRKRIYPSLSVHFKLAKQVNEFNILFNVEVMRKDDSKMNIGRHTLDGCKFLSSFYGNNMYGKFFQRIQSVSNLPKSCPVAANQHFEIHNYTILADEYPPVVPAMSHRLGLKIQVENNVIADIDLAGSIIY